MTKKKHEQNIRSRRSYGRTGNLIIRVCISSIVEKMALVPKVKRLELTDAVGKFIGF